MSNVENAIHPRFLTTGGVFIEKKYHTLCVFGTGALARNNTTSKGKKCMLFFNLIQF